MSDLLLAVAIGIGVGLVAKFVVKIIEKNKSKKE